MIDSSLGEYIETLYPLLNVPDTSNINWEQRLGKREGFFAGVKFQTERSYTKEDMLNFAWWFLQNVGQYPDDYTAHFGGEYLEVFKQDKLNS